MLSKLEWGRLVLVYGREERREMQWITSLVSQTSTPSVHGGISISLLASISSDEQLAGAAGWRYKDACSVAPFKEQGCLLIF